MKLFTQTAPLEYVAIDILGELVATKRGNTYLLVLSDRCESWSAPLRTASLKRITAAQVASAFVHHWVFVYGPPAKILSDNKKQFTSKLFQKVWKILGIRNIFITTYHSQTNGQVEPFNRKLWSALR